VYKSEGGSAAAAAEPTDRGSSRGREGGPGGNIEAGVIHMSESQPIIANERDRQALDWLRARVGADAIQGAIERLAGQRRPYVSNLAKVLGVTLPTAAELAAKPTDRETARARIAELQAAIRGQ
jgi:hypothetical protein